MQWRGNILPVIDHGLKGASVYFDFASQWSWVPKALSELRLSEAVERNWLEARNAAQRRWSQPRLQRPGPERLSPVTSEKAQNKENTCINSFFFHFHGQVNYYTKWWICLTKWEKKFKLLDWLTAPNQKGSSINSNCDYTALCWCSKRGKKDGDGERNTRNS